jgi:predicted unusual protein kinase regulating ubiquinone biosynthesis (AarF/ABC1/UbiB family)
VSRRATCSRSSLAPTARRCSTTVCSTPTPHPGNLFVVDEPGAAERPRLLFVDFGLSRRLDPALRRELRLGIYALLQQNLPGFLDGMERIGAIAPGHRDDAARAVGAMFARVKSHGGLAAGRRAGALAQGRGGGAAAADAGTAPADRSPALCEDALLRVLAGAELDAEVDMMKLCLPSLLRFLAERD